MGKGLQCPVDGSSLVSWFPSNPGCTHREVPDLWHGQCQGIVGLAVPILLLPHSAGARPSAEMPRKAGWRTLAPLWQPSQVHHGPKQDFWLLCSSLVSDAVTVTVIVTCLQGSAGGRESWI